MFFCAVIHVLLLLLSVHAQTYQHGSFEYYVEKNHYVTNYTQAEELCRQRNAELAVVTTIGVKNFLVEKIGNLTGNSLIASDYSYSRIMTSKNNKAF